MYRVKRIALMLILVPFGLPLFTQAVAQDSLESGEVAPMGQWLEYREAVYNGNPLLVHLRTGYERAVIMPEAVRQEDETQTLPGTEIVIDNNIVAFYPTVTFKRQSVIFIGLETGTAYDLRIRASTRGIRQPIRINR